MKMHGQVVMASGGLMRQELTVKTGQKTVEMVVIMNMDKGVILTLMKDQKLAVPMKLTDMPKAMRDKMAKENDQLAELKRLVRNAEKELGEKTIDGVKAKGFQVEDDGMVMDIWVDAKTALPIRIEGEMIDAKMKIVMSDIEFVKTVDLDLFSVEPPKGYTIQPQKTFSLKPASIKDIADMFKAWTQLRSGTFPETINPVVFVEDAKAHAQKLKDAGDTPKELNALMKSLSQQIVSVMMLMQSNETLHYQGKGVKLGDKDTAILWYKPEGKDKYVVMFGDLSVKRMLETELPKSSTEKSN
jgi:outer membrane lipoprotein-sorting protein